MRLSQLARGTPKPEVAAAAVFCLSDREPPQPRAAEVVMVNLDAFAPVGAGNRFLRRIIRRCARSWPRQFRFPGVPFPSGVVSSIAASCTFLYAR